MKIQLQKNYIPIPFVDDEGNTVLEYKFYKTDDNFRKVKDVQKELEKIEEIIEAGEDYDDIGKARKTLEISYNHLLGEKAFDEIYELCHSTQIMLSYFTEIVVKLAHEITNVEGLEEMDKYLEDWKQSQASDH